jgi:endonuclease YncB( thermonuclease family)
MLATFTFGLASGNGDIKGKVTAVVDGNTVEISTSENQVLKVLLADIDSPELGQEFGVEAKEFLEKAVLQKNVVVQLQGKDRRGNHVAIVLVNGKADPRIELLKRGLAWTSEKNPVEDLEAHRIEAKSKGKGLWSQESPVPPWTYRREQSMSNPKGSS